MDHPHSDQQAARRAAKVGHRKSRNGCSKCKTRRVKAPPPPPARKAGAAARSTARPTAPRLSDSPASTHVSPGDLSGMSVGTGGTGATSPGRHDPIVSEEEARCFSATLRLWSGTNTAGHDVDVDALGGGGGGGGGSGGSGGSRSRTADDNNAEDGLLPESRARRLLEHRLMQNFMFHLSVPFPVAPNNEWKELWEKTLPAMALTYDNVLYALLAQSATHLLRAEPGNRELFRVRQAYLIAAMRAQRRVVGTLSLAVASADAVCLSALLMLVNAFAMLHERVTEPYVPPVEWLQLGQGSGAVIWTSVGAIVKSGEQARSATFTIATSQPNFGVDESYFDATNRDARLNALLTAHTMSSSSSSSSGADDWDDAATREAYEKTLSYIGSVQHAMARGEPVYMLTRRIQGFTMVVPSRFIAFVAEQRPRALVVLAHFFATVSQISGVWWLGGIGGSSDGGGGHSGKESIAKREVRGIRSVLPEEWLGYMAWPLQAAGLT
ncbi:c6 zinc finger domain containing protein [Niveomyces insectorum RCEF 264]|uniref:C6 zinc finger domain containing protein n=1 Tax=Niveomyces insectorum RCEF 264 TaxID=1081102 RepID=A0A167UW05_9HYPO|nr:c6 zinc finger domain containing protein [Niveomyces insectorum RCEF 264]